MCRRNLTRRTAEGQGWGQPFRAAAALLRGAPARRQAETPAPQWAGCSLVLAFALASSACVPWTVRPMEEAQPRFDAARYVDSIWSAKLLPAIVDSAVDARELIGKLNADSAATAAALGRREGDGPWRFAVRGEGRIVALEAESRRRRIAVDLAPLDGKPDVYIEAGPVLRGTALRDAAGFIHFDQFVNQIEYANVANELNARVVKTVVPAPDAAIAGRTVAFWGVFTPLPGGAGEIVPVKLEIGSAR